MTEEERVVCRTPTEGKNGVTRIPKWKFGVLQAAITKIIGAAGQDGILSKDLSEAVRAELAADELERLGKLGWHVIGIRLEMEVRGEIKRMGGKGPPRIALV